MCIIKEKINMIKPAFILTALLAVIPIYAEDPGKTESDFKLRHLFTYKHPVKKGDTEKKWNFSLFGGYTEKKGNTETERISYSAAYKYDDNITSFRASYNGFYGKTKNVKDENKGIGSFNFSYYMLWRFEFFAYSTVEYNEIIELIQRNNSGAGIKFIFIRNKYLLADLSGAPIFHYEKFEERDAEKDKRWSIRGRMELYPFDEDYMIRYLFNYIPAMDDSSNYRTIHDFAASKKIMGNIHFRAGYRREYNTYTKEILEKKPLLKKRDETLYMQIGITI